MFSSIHFAFSFLTILVKGKISYNNQQIQNSIYYFPLVGASIALIASIISILCYHFLFPKEICAIIFLLVECIISRGLHHDGLCDVADAYGSGRTNEKFREILKDSRIGSFGVIALLFYFLLTISSLSNLFSFNSYYFNTVTNYNLIIFLSIGGMWSRLGLLFLPTFTKLYTPPQLTQSLAKTMFVNYHKKYFFYWFFILFCLIGYFYHIKMFLILITITIIFTYPLYYITKRENGYNGDFLGACCLLWEISYYLAGIVIIT